MTKLIRPCVACKHYNFQTAQCKKFFVGDIVKGMNDYSLATEIRKEKCGLYNPLFYTPVKIELEVKYATSCLKFVNPVIILSSLTSIMSSVILMSNCGPDLAYKAFCVGFVSSLVLFAKVGDVHQIVEKERTDTFNQLKIIKECEKQGINVD